MMASYVWARALCGVALGLVRQNRPWMGLAEARKSLNMKLVAYDVFIGAAMGLQTNTGGSIILIGFGVGVLAGLLRYLVLYLRHGASWPNVFVEALGEGFVGAIIGWILATPPPWSTGAVDVQTGIIVGAMIGVISVAFDMLNLKLWYRTDDGRSPPVRWGKVMEIFVERGCPWAAIGGAIAIIMQLRLSG